MRTHDMTSGRPARLILSFALPLMAGSVFQQAYTLTDTAIVGQYAGVGALAAIGATDWFNYLVLSVILGFTQGFSILLSQRCGAGDEGGLKKAYAMAMRLSALLAFIMTALGILLAEPILGMLSTPEDILPDALVYIRVFFIGTPFVTFCNFYAGALRALGDSGTPFHAMIVSSLLNIALDFLFVLAFGWGLAGAAAATVLAQGAAMLYCFMAVRRAQRLHLTRTDKQIDLAVCRRHLLLGLPVALQNGLIACGGMAVQRVVNGFGFLFIAGYTATNKLYGILELASIAFGHALCVYTGQNMGAGNQERIRQGRREATWLSLITSAFIACLMLVFGRALLSLFIHAEPQEYETVMNYAYEFLKTMSLFLPVLYLLYCYRSILQGMGDTVTPMLSGVAELGMRVGAAVLLSGVLGYRGVFVAEVAAWTGAVAILGSVCFYKTKKGSV